MTAQANNGASAAVESRDDATRSRKPIEVELYVCEECLKHGIETVGKLPQGRGSKYAAMCTGPVGHDHKQKRMTLMPFILNVEKLKT